MTRTPAYLAALASSAVPGLDPVAVRAARARPGDRCDVAFVTDTQRRAWVVRVPTTPAVGAQLDAAVPLLGLIARRLPFQVPSPRGFVGVPDGRAVVYPFLHGRSVVLDEVPPGPGVAAELGRALAALHNIDRAVFEEAGVPVYDAETYRSRHLADLDRAAATGHVPTALLSRWERALEDVSAWRFAPTPVHGDVRGGRVLVSFAQEDDPGTATVRGITGWEHAKVADPADDLAAFAAECSPETFESICEAYAVARIERPDRHLRLRARLAAELRALAGLLDAVAAGEPLLITRRAAELRALDQYTADLPDLVPAPPVEPEPVRPVPPADPAGGASAAPASSSSGSSAGSGSSGSSGSSGPVGEDRDESQDTQRLLVGDAAGATTVIPPEELGRLRSVPTAGAGDGAEEPEARETTGETEAISTDAGREDADVVVVPVASEVARDDSWYQVIEPIAPPEDDSAESGGSTASEHRDDGDARHRSDDATEGEDVAPGPAHPHSISGADPGSASPTIVLVDEDVEPATETDHAPAAPGDQLGHAPTAQPAPDEPPAPTPPAPVSGTPARRHRRATRP